MIKKLQFLEIFEALRLLFGFAQSAPAINLAIKRARNESLIDNINFTFTWLNCNCDTSLTAGYTNKLFLDENVDAIIGPPCVTAVQSVIWEFQWKEISLIYIQDDARRACGYFQKDFEDIINPSSNITIVFKMEIYPKMEISIGRNGSKYDGFWKDTNSTNDGRDADALKAARRSIIVCIYFTPP
uniref:Receptor ligand binding region domain-containing protein n=1 Tax=Meloidogyne javanica TaxID=6303 RepID=A0A915N478_MELJA